MVLEVYGQVVEVLPPTLDTFFEEYPKVWPIIYFKAELFNYLFS